MDAIVSLVFALPWFVLVMNFGLALVFRWNVKSTFIKKDYGLQDRKSVV